MALPSDSDARRFYRVAYQRLEDGMLILDVLNRPNTSIYLAGYAVECIFKALVLANTPKSQRHHVNWLFQGTQGHDLIRLRKAVEDTGINFPDRGVNDLASVAYWSVGMRYDPEMGDPKEAAQFMQAVQRLVHYADQRM